MSDLTPADLLHYSSISEYFIDNVVRNDNFDFSLEQIMYLCDIEPENCSHVFNILESLVAERSKDYQILNLI